MRIESSIESRTPPQIKELEKNLTRMGAHPHKGDSGIVYEPGHFVKNGTIELVSGGGILSTDPPFVKSVRHRHFVEKFPKFYRRDGVPVIVEFYSTQEIDKIEDDLPPLY